MKLERVFSLIIALATISLNVSAADTSFYLGAKAGSLDTNKSIYGNENGEVVDPKLIKYDNVSLAGVEFQLLSNLESNFIMWGLGSNVMFNDGSILDGGTIDIDLKFGAHFKDINFYGLGGIGLHSLSEYTVATGTFYGAGLNYNIFKHLAAKIEYRKHDLKTRTDDDEDPTDGQKYKLSGFLVRL